MQLSRLLVPLCFSFGFGTLPVHAANFVCHETRAAGEGAGITATIYDLGSSNDAWWQNFNAALIVQKLDSSAQLFEGEVRVSGTRVGNRYNANLVSDLAGVSASFHITETVVLTVLPQNCTRAGCDEPVVTTRVHTGALTIGETSHVIKCTIPNAL